MRAAARATEALREPLREARIERVPHQLLEARRGIPAALAPGFLGGLDGHERLGDLELLEASGGGVDLEVEGHQVDDAGRLDALHHGHEAGLAQVDHVGAGVPAAAFLLAHHQGERARVQRMAGDRNLQGGSWNPTCRRPFGARDRRGRFGGVLDYRTEREAFLAALERKYDWEPEGDETEQAWLFRLDPR